jgi:glycosyltransferase involved in cell wall biosynthesis
MESADHKTSICFVALNTYGRLSGRLDLGQIGGGTEVQVTLVGKELARRGYQVSFVTWDDGQVDGVEHDGIKVFKTCRRDAGLPGLRFFYPRWASLWQALERVDADIYLQMGAGIETGQVALWCQHRRRHFIFAIASDSHCLPRRSTSRGWRDNLLYLRGLRTAKVIVAQTSYQQELLGIHFRKPSTLIRSCSPDPYEGQRDLPARGGIAGRRILWIGRNSPEKRLDRVTELAEALPSHIFDVVSPSLEGRTAEARAVVSRLQNCDNVHLHGRVSDTELNSLYEEAKLLLCTSDHEGYPTTYVEAWARGIPVVGTVDPDCVVTDFGLGAVAEDSEGLTKALVALTENEEGYRRCSRAARQFFLDHHTITATASGYEKLFTAIVGADDDDLQRRAATERLAPSRKV